MYTLKKCEKYTTTSLVESRGSNNINGWFQKISIPYHRWHEHFNPAPPLPLPSENPKYSTPPCSLNSKIVNPSSPPEFPIFFSDHVEFLFDRIKLPLNRKLALFFPLQEKSSHNFRSSKQATQVCEHLIKCIVAFSSKCYLEVAYHSGRQKWSSWCAISRHIENCIHRGTADH